MIGPALAALAAFAQPESLACRIVMAESFSLLFFETGSTALSRRVRADLDDWVRVASSRLYPTRFILIGGTDRVGSRDANLRLSHRRAWAVRDYLVGRGIERAHIEVSAFGEDRPLVETADEVAEPQNRLVQLTAAPDAREPSARPACTPR
jgi:peptidoglycan-associated lipoprotein